MLTIYLVRHGKTEWNVQTRWQGWGNGELTAEGMQGATLLSKRLKDEPIDKVYASSSKRAYHTAEIIIGRRSIEIVKEDVLREMHFGDWEGRTKDEVIAQYANEVKAFWETPHLYTRDQGELFPDVYERAAEAWKMILENHSSGTVLIVSHSIFLRVLLSYLKDLPLEHLFKQEPLLNTSLTQIQVEDGKVSIIFEGDTSHLVE
ncbi:histidine phosphatase family protein [Peribacillus deserti]|uniref:histidine phosphatase family protein n=1 Tax=Peribacillus deserti TaxID=673318 RepID=UPI0015E0BB0F|nr:histidine phosphatase family protein [Peribacillus deserti]